MINREIRAALWEAYKSGFDYSMAKTDEHALRVSFERWMIENYPNVIKEEPLNVGVGHSKDQPVKGPDGEPVII